ncbi:hypothetical protein AAFM46_11945 [Arthrobacter sp. TMP15]|uniref:sunset domain-containing protein n=1 Tax=Arthrobacter sp. TMP15 TaxID=3140789 RepID=UPI0031BB0F8F
MDVLMRYGSRSLRRFLLLALAALAVIVPILVAPTSSFASELNATRVANFVAGPATVGKGKDVVYTGTVQSASGTSWANTGSVTINVYFDPDGAEPSALVRTLTTGATGSFKAGAPATVSGSWTVEVPAQGSYAGSVSESKAVQVVESAPATSTRVANFVAGPATVGKGKDVVYTGTIQRASGTSWANTGSVTINVYFDPDGSAPNKLVRTLKTGVTGSFKAGAPATVSGKWTIQVPAQGSYSASLTPAKTVKVVAATSATRVANFTAGPATVGKGKDVVYTGTIQSASGTSWANTGSVTINVYFDPDGSAPNKLVRTLKTGATGSFKAGAPATVSGKWTIQVPAQGSYSASLTPAKTVKVVAATSATRVGNFTAGPATVGKGKDVVYTGTIQRASGTSWANTGSVTINVYFDPDGSAPNKLVRTLKTGATGSFKAGAPATVSGKWTIQVPAQGSYKSSVSAAKTVKVTVSNPTITNPIDKWNCPAWAPIKGNDSSMIYHMPWQSLYSNTTPETCFSTEAAAVKAGYRKSKR